MRFELPFSAIRGEVIIVQATVFNYLDQDQQVKWFSWNSNFNKDAYTKYVYDNLSYLSYLEKVETLVKLKVKIRVL